MTTATLNSPKDYAYCYHDKGFSFFVLKNPDTGTEVQLKDRKRPAVDWTLYQIMRPSKIQIERWFSKNPNYNIAIVTGSISKIIAFDVDGPAAVKRVEEKRMETSTNLRVALDVTMVNRTGSGGTHIVFKIEDDISDISNKVLWSDGEKHSQILMQGNNHYIVAAPSRHPNAELYEWNGKDPQLITRQELNEFIRLVSSKEEQQGPAQQKTEAEVGTTTATRVLTLDVMEALLKWIMPVYLDGSRDHLLFYLSGAMRKDGGFSHEDTRRLVEEISERSPYNDEDLQKNLLVVDRTYRDSLKKINGKADLKDLLIDNYQAQDENEYQTRVEAFTQICQIINGPPSPTTSDDDTGEAFPLDAA